ncbi:MAG TPA: EAL domain-containing protein [Burkholderiaceae bacterium]
MAYLAFRCKPAPVTTRARIASWIAARLRRGEARLAKALAQSRHEQQHQAALLAQVEEIALIGSTETLLATGETTLSAGLCRLFGEAPSADPVPAQWLWDRVPDEERQLVKFVRESVQTDEPFEFQHRIVRRDGGIRTVLHRGRIELGPDGTPLRLHATLQDITSRCEAERALDDLAHADRTTGLPNRHALLNRLGEATFAAQRDGRPLGLLVIGVDQFGLTHESLGHAASDQLLRGVTQRLLHVAPGAGTFAYIGGGEFALLMELADAGEAAAQGMARTLIDGVAGPIQAGGTEIFVTAAIGVALWPADAGGPDELVDNACASARQARQLGTHRVCFYTPEANARAALRLANEAGLRHAIDRDELYLCYQPQVDLATGRMIGLEALLRWQDGTRGNISPAEFIPLAESTGLIIPIGEWVLRTACRDIVRWQAEGLQPLRITMNLSMMQLQLPDIVERIQAVLEETGVDPQRLGIEVTESMLIEQVDHVAKTLSRLKALGIEISLDDFGTGYSNLGYLNKLPIDVLKIDRSFVHDVTAPTQDVSITRALINMAHGLGMKVMAEGVENEGQLALLVASHCNQIQGYFFSRPVRADAIAQMLREDKRLPEHLLVRQSRQRTLLVVDDEDNIIASLRRLLRRDGYHIITANSGAQGLQRLAEHEVDVILSDQRMPGMTGVEFLRRAKELYPHTVRMTLSGYTELQSITDAINEGAVYKFLTKPWDDERLREHVNEAFRHKEMADENRQLGARLQSANDELATVNQRLQRLMERQREQIRRDEQRLLSAHELLEGIPTPVIGFDVEGVVAYLNADAHELFPLSDSPLGRNAAEALSPELAHVWRSGDGVHVRVQLGERHYQAVCRPIGDHPHRRGKLMVLTPHGPGPWVH